MIDRNMARGLFLGAIAVAFGAGAMGYSIGNLSHAGPGLFPLMVSALLLVIAIVSIVRARFVQPEPLQINLHNISILLGALVAFALVSHFSNMTLGVVAMVFVAGFAGKAGYSVVRNLKIAAGLLVVAYVFQKGLGLNLPLY